MSGGKPWERGPLAELLHFNRDRFYADLVAKPLLVVLERKGIVKKRDKPFIDSEVFRDDEERLKGFFFHKFQEGKKPWDMDIQDFLSILEESGNRDFLKKILSEHYKHRKKCISGSTFIHTDPTELASAVFTSEGGILYSPYHGVTVHIPKGAIPKGQRVRITFKPEVESKELDKFLSHPLVEGSLLCSHLFDFDAELLGGEGSEEFVNFSQDVWIEVPYCHYPDCITSEHDSFSLFYVVSQCGDDVQQENRVVFGFGYPYANICIRHFSHYSVLCRIKRRFVPETLDPLKKECSSLKEHGVVRHVKKCQNGKLDKSEMEEDAAYPSTSFINQNTPAYENGTHACLLFFVFQPKDRHKRRNWVADVFILPNLPEAYTIMDSHQYDKVDCSGAHPFSVSVSSDCVFIDGDSSVQNGWTADLFGEQIPLFTFGTVSKLLSSMLSRVSSRVLPKCEARITNTGSKEKLKYSISVRPSRPRVSYKLTSDVLYNVTDTEKSMTPLPVSTLVMKVDWSTDRPLFAILSLIVPQQFLRSISRALGLSDVDLQHIQSNTSSEDVGELLYQVFSEVLSRGSSSFSKYFNVFTHPKLGLDPTVKDRIVHIIRSYINYKQRGYNTISSTDETVVTHGCHNLLRFLRWAEVTLECLQVPRPSQKPIGSESRRRNLFKTLSIRIIHVWKMIGRLLLLEDHVIDGIVYASTHDMSLGTRGHVCYQMLYSWAEQTVNQSEVTYNNLITVLRVIACCHGNRLVADALYCIQNVTVDLPSVDISDAGSTEAVQGPVTSEVPSSEVGPVSPPSLQGPPGEEFDSEAFMNRFVERFLESVDSHAIVTRLEIEYVISKDLSYTINHSSVDRGNEELLLYLRKHADAESIGKLCDVMISKEAYRAMQKLGKDMKEDLAKLTGEQNIACM